METERPQTPNHDEILIPTNEESPTSPSTNSETSTSSTDTDITSICASPSSSSRTHTTKPQKLLLETRISKDPCLQCHLLGLKCSFSSDRQKPKKFTNKSDRMRCSRCARNGEEFCIRQGEERSREGGLVPTYEADGVEKEVVMSRAEELTGEKKEKGRFVLPRPGIWKKEILRSVWEKGWDFAGWKDL